MKHTRTIPYIVKITWSNGLTESGEYSVKQSGKPTADNLSKYIDVLVASMKPGGCNEHLGLKIIPSNAVLIKQGKTPRLNVELATWKAPMFWVI